MKKKKLVFLSSIASPHQVRFCESLQEYYDSTFLFYDHIGSRPDWWKVKLPKQCKILSNVLFKKQGKYLTFSFFNILRGLNPDIIMLGGLSIPSNYIAYIWAKMNGCKTIIFTERSRDKNGKLRKKNLIWTILHFLYRNVDLVIVSAPDSIQQFKDFGFERVEYCPYATDLTNYFTHPPRSEKKFYTFLFPNRLTAIYNPLKAIDVFYEMYKLNPKSLLQMNAQGELYSECINKIKSYNLEPNVSFLNEIEQWDDLHKVYENCDILIFPALFSNGNFTIIEAMASGMGIVISNKILGIGKLIRNDHNGFNCEPETHFFIDSIHNYIDNPTLFDIHAKRNREIAYEYSAEGVAKMFANLVNSKVFL